VRTVYQVRVEVPRRALDVKGHFVSKRVFVSLEQAQAYAPVFAEICCGEGLYDLEAVTSTKFTELALYEEGDA